MDSLPIPVVNELTNLATAIMPSIQTSLVNLKDELLRSSLTLDDGFKQYFLKFINDQISEAYNELQKQSPKSTEKRPKKRGASDDDRKKATNEAQAVSGAKKLRKSSVAQKSTHEPIVKEPIIQQKIVDRKQTSSRKSSNVHKSDSVRNTRAARMLPVASESPTVRKSPAGKSSAGKSSAGKSPVRKSPVHKSPSRQSSIVPKTPTVSEPRSVSKLPAVRALKDSVDKKSSEIGEPVDDNDNKIDSFFTKLRETVVNKKWWLELHDMEKKNVETNSKEDNAIEYLKTRHGCIMVSNTNQIKYTEIDGIDYGFSPLDNSFGFMRFRPKAVKKMATSTNTVEFHVISGEFTLQSNDEAFDISTGYDVLIPKGAEYGITNRSSQVSVIELTYLNPKEPTDA